MTGVKPDGLDPPSELDEMFFEVWGWFLKLNKRRTSNGFGINPLTYSEILSFFHLQEYYPCSWELSMIEEWDDVVMEVYQEQQERKKKQEESKRKHKKR